MRQIYHTKSHSYMVRSRFWHCLALTKVLYNILADVLNTSTLFPSESFDVVVVIESVKVRLLLSLVTFSRRVICRTPRPSLYTLP